MTNPIYASYHEPAIGIVMTSREDAWENNHPRALTIHGEFRVVSKIIDAIAFYAFPDKHDYHVFCGKHNEGRPI